jgi:putative chitinase
MSVASLQANLNARGMNAGAADGALGPRTYQAMAEYLTGGAAPDGVGAALAHWLPKGSIDTRLELIEFMANVAHESNFQPKAENLNYSAKRLTQVWPNRFPTIAAAQPYAMNPVALANKTYGGRMGNVKPNDGYDFRGRGAPQLTGREAYRIVGGLVGMPFESQPELVNTMDGSIAAAVGFWLWKRIGPVATAGETVTVRKMWNGGTNGLSDVQNKVKLLKALWPS